MLRRKWLVNLFPLFLVAALVPKHFIPSPNILIVAFSIMRQSSSSSRQRTTHTAKQLVHLVQTELAKLADPSRAEVMQKYCKTNMPMYGIPKPTRVGVEKSMYALLTNNSNTKARNIGVDMDDFCSLDPALYRACVQALWNLPHREEKYLAIDLAMKYKECITLDSFPIYEEMLREDYMWWDLCDPIAVHLVGGVARKEWNHTFIKSRLRNHRGNWIQDDNLWIRRSAILCQLTFQKDTDQKVLFDVCRQCMHEKEFFIRKAIGWALRSCSRFNPDAVQEFLTLEKTHLSRLSFREGSKLLVKQVRM